jgi:hypothetical protein
VSAPRAVRRHLGRGRRRCVSVLVNLRLPKHRGTPRPETSRAGSGPSGPSNKLLVRRGHLVSISRLHDRGSVVTEMRRGSWELEQDQRLQQPPASSSRPADHTPGASDYSSPWRGLRWCLPPGRPRRVESLSGDLQVAEKSQSSIPFNEHHDTYTCHATCTCRARYNAELSHSEDTPGSVSPPCRESQSKCTPACVMSAEGRGRAPAEGTVHCWWAGGRQTPRTN